MATLVLLRHGESVWNAEGLFTGWVDVDLSEKGEEEAVTGGDLILDADLQLDVVHTSVLKRAIRTANHARHPSRRDVEGRAAGPRPARRDRRPDLTTIPERHGTVNPVPLT